MSDKNTDMKWTKETKQRLLKKGSYSFILSVIMLAVVVAINLLASQLPASVNQIDISEKQLYTLTSQTKQILDGLEQDVTLYFIEPANSKDDILGKLLGQYEEYSSHIKVVVKDPDMYPLFTQSYTEDTVEANSVIVECGEKSQVINYSEMYLTQMDYNTYQETTTAFDGEGQITSVINVLTSNDLPVLYTLVGHNELTLSDNMQSLISKENISLEELSLLSVESIPDDCQLLLINSPETDLTDSDMEKITAYVEKGGNIMLNLYYSYMATQDMKNINKLVEMYNMRVDNVVVMESKEDFYAYQTPYYLIPKIEQTAYTSDIYNGNAFVLAAIMMPIKNLDDESAGTVFAPLLTTSDSSYGKADAANLEQIEQEDGDPTGPFTIAAVSSRNSGETEGQDSSKMALFTSESILDETVNSYVGNTNYKLAMNVISQLVDHDKTAAIPSKDLTFESLSIKNSQATLWRNVTMFILPLAFLLAALVVWLRRRSR